MKHSGSLILLLLKWVIKPFLLNYRCILGDNWLEATDMQLWNNVLCMYMKSYVSFYSSNHCVLNTLNIHPKSSINKSMLKTRGLTHILNKSRWQGQLIVWARIHWWFHKWMPVVGSGVGWWREHAWTSWGPRLKQRDVCGCTMAPTSPTIEVLLSEAEERVSQCWASGGIWYPLGLTSLSTFTILYYTLWLMPSRQQFQLYP